MFDIDSVILVGPMGAQAFWIWLTLGILILGAEIFLGTQWLLWSAAAAGLVAVICLTGLPFGFVLQVTTFAVLSLVMALLTRRLLKVPKALTDINEPHTRLLGKQAQVLSGFDVVTGGERTGRVMFDGVEWPAVLTAGDAQVAASDRVVIEAVTEGRLYVTPA
ncbi:NfeD family protein [Asticcacaulis solisilvae]|uniref:NfeD family protein n=1 Tax=Asticcacaulis solisilvae TaxID=1217274 RepID=UPI003FD76CC7